MPEDTHAPRAWLANSPETLIRQYGIPTQVYLLGTMNHEFGALDLQYILDMYFSDVDLIVEYDSDYDFAKFDPATGQVRVCPVTHGIRFIRIWLGKNPYDPPLTPFPIEQAASMSREAFSALLTGPAKKACFNVSGTLFSN